MCPSDWLGDFEGSIRVCAVIVSQVGWETLKDVTGWLGDFEGLVHICVVIVSQIGWETLKDQFTQLLEDSNSGKEHDNIFDDLKAAVKNEGMHKHKWEEKAEDSLVSVFLHLILISGVSASGFIVSTQWPHSDERNRNS